MATRASARPGGTHSLPGRALLTPKAPRECSCLCGRTSVLSSNPHFLETSPISLVALASEPTTPSRGRSFHIPFSRSRLVNECLAEELPHIHAFEQKTLTPEQWTRQRQE